MNKLLTKQYREFVSKNKEDFTYNINARMSPMFMPEEAFNGFVTKISKENEFLYLKLTPFHCTEEAISKKIRKEKPNDNLYEIFPNLSRVMQTVWAKVEAKGIEDYLNCPAIIDRNTNGYVISDVEMKKEDVPFRKAFNIKPQHYEKIPKMHEFMGRSTQIQILPGEISSDFNPHQFYINMRFGDKSEIFDVTEKLMLMDGEASDLEDLYKKAVQGTVPHFSTEYITWNICNCYSDPKDAERLNAKIPGEYNQYNNTLELYEPVTRSVVKQLKKLPIKVRYPITDNLKIPAFGLPKKWIEESKKLIENQELLPYFKE